VAASFQEIYRVGFYRWQENYRFEEVIKAIVAHIVPEPETGRSNGMESQPYTGEG